MRSRTCDVACKGVYNSLIKKGNDDAIEAHSNDVSFDLFDHVLFQQAISFCKIIYFVQIGLCIKT